VIPRLLNFPEMWRFVSEHRADRSVWDPADDLELALYASIFRNDFLHYGYFPVLPVDPETISLATVRQAMNDYATLIVDRIQPTDRVLDVGCGMGGLVARLAAAGIRATGLTPNVAQVDHIRARWPAIQVVNAKLEDARGAGLAPSFDVVVNAESFQYVDLQVGMAAVHQLFAPDAVNPRWVCVDYFRLNAAARNKSGHLLQAFETGLAQHGFDVVERVDITENVLPSLAYGTLLAGRLALPLARFTIDKFFLRHPLLAYMFQGWMVRKLTGVRLDNLDPAVFRRDKRYLLFTLALR
jgi:SAM-dependent methyltransferase